MWLFMSNQKLKETLDELKKYAEQLGYFPTSTEWNAYALNKYLTVSSITRNTGKTWEELRKEFGFKPKNKRFTKEEIIKQLQQAAKEVNGNLTLKRFLEWRGNNPEIVTQGIIEKTFGSFNEAKKAAGLPVSKTFRHKYTLKEVEKALIDCYNEIGLFSNRDYDEWTKRKSKEGKIYPSLSVVIKMAGYVNDLKRRLGIPVYEKSISVKPITEDEVIRSLKQFVRENLKRVDYEKWSMEYNKPSLSTLDKFGGYKKLLKKVLKEMSDEIE